MDKREAEAAGSITVARSLDCDRELTTIEPLIKGQQFMTPVWLGVDGVVSKFSSGDESLDS